jgi:hypothetical protein
MKTKFLNTVGVEVLSKESQKLIIGQAGIDIRKCGCSCSGAVTGPAYCASLIACTQGYNCTD